MLQHQGHTPPVSAHSGTGPFIVQQQPATIPFNRKWHITKIVIRGWSALIATLAIILAIVLAVEVQRHFTEDDDFAFSSNYDISFVVWVASLPPAVLVFLWDIAEFITLCVRRKSTGRGIHPGAHVGIDLILWMSLVIIWGSLVAAIPYTGSYVYDWSEDYYYVDQDFDNTLRNLSLAITVFLILLSLIHFFLFVRACVETDQRNRMQRNGGPIMILPTSGNSYPAHPYYNLNNPAAQPMWFQPAPAGKRNKRGPQILQPMMDPSGGHQTPPMGAIQPPPQVYGPGNTSASGDRPASKAPSDLTHLTGFYAPTTTYRGGPKTPEMAQVPPSHPPSPPSPPTRSPPTPAPAEASGSGTRTEENVRPGTAK